MNTHDASRDLTIGLVHNWPGKKNSELDLIYRIRSIIESQSHSVLIIDPLGYELDDDTFRKEHKPIADGRCELIINLHYLNPKFFSGLSYTVNWNPVEYILNDPITRIPVPQVHLDYLADCFRSHDRVLTAGSEILDHFVECLRENRQGSYLPESRLPLHTTISSVADSLGERIKEDSLGPSTFKVFYIGMNWEKLSVSPERNVRHDKLLQILDKSGRFQFYGLREQEGVFLWEGFQNYHGELPFDGGRSIISQAKRCGASLILSSEQHRTSGVASSRIFQACAAGSIVISDRNPFIEKNFGDSILYFDYGASDGETAKNILSQVSWIESHWLESQAKAAEAQKIFSEKFALESEIQTILATAKMDLEHRARLIERLSSKSVAIHYLYRSDNPVELGRLLENAGSQSHKNCRIYIYSHSASLTQSIESIADNFSTLRIHIIELSGLRFTTGITFKSACESGEDFHLWYSEGFGWRSDHLLNLLNVCEGGRWELAYSPYFASKTDLEGNTDDTMRYFIYGLNGGYDKISSDALARFELVNLPLGNILAGINCIESAVRSNSIIELFDLGAMILTLRILESEDPETIGFSPIISSIHSGAQALDSRSTYKEYSSFGKPWCYAEETDQHLFQAIANGSAVDRRLSLAGGDSQAATDLVSRHFSIAKYVEHILKNRPKIQYYFQKIHQVLTKGLKLS